MSAPLFPSFTTQIIELPDARIHLRIGGEGPPLLLLHGYPQTHMMWHPVAEDLARTHRVILPDLRGYGRSTPRNEDFSFRAMAADQIALMAHLGHAHFDVIAHDRGARVAHRLALDAPHSVRSVALLDILPTLEVWRRMDDWLAKRYYHWMFLAQPGGMPQRLINNDPVFFLHAALSGLSGDPRIFAPKALADYEAAAQRPEVVNAWCADYRAAAHEDLDHDRRDEGRTLPQPCLILWGSDGVVGKQVDPVQAWRSWFPKATGHSVQAGHFLVEERPDTVLAALRAHLASLPEPNARA